MSTFVLVHGAYHGAWCWHKVVPELEARGHEVVTLDLPAHGVDLTPVEEVTFDDYVERVCDAIDAQDEEVVLVGHSMAGMVVTQATERRPESIETLVYLTAYLPGNGESMLDQRVPGSFISQKFAVDEERGVGIIEEDALEELFYADCSASDLALARSLVRGEPMEPLSVPVSISEDRFGSVRRAFIRCEQDRAITPEKQTEMIEDHGSDEVLSLDASHSPFLAMPEKTVDAFEEAAED